VGAAPAASSRGAQRPWSSRSRRGGAAGVRARAAPSNPIDSHAAGGYQRPRRLYRV